MAFRNCPVEILALMVAFLPVTAGSRAASVALCDRTEEWKWEQAIRHILRLLNRRWDAGGWALAARAWAQRNGPPLPRLGHMTGVTRDQAG